MNEPTRVRRAGDPLAGEAGFTMVELLIAMAASMIIFAAGMSLTEVSLKASTRVEDRVDVAQRGRTALERITQQLRSQVCLGPGTPALVEAKADSVTFYADLGDDAFTPEKRRLTYANGSIIEDTYAGSGTPPATTFPPTPTRTQTILTDVVPVAGVPVFRYYAYTTISPVRPTLLLTPPVGGSLSSTDLARTVGVTVAYVVRPRANRAQNNRVETTFEDSVYSRTADANNPTAGPTCI